MHDSKVKFTSGDFIETPGTDYTELFLPYLADNVPDIVTELGTVVAEGIAIRKLVFHSRKVGMQDENVYAIIARPTGSGSYPGVLYLHGGAEHADEHTAVNWAKRGYIAITLDEPGIADPGKTPYSSGPWKELAYGANRFVVKPEITASTIFGGVAAALNAFHLLLAQPGIEQDHIGITGISWGGYLTTMLSGLLGDKVRAAYSVFGAGNYDKGTAFWEDTMLAMTPVNREIWLTCLDAGRHAAKIQASFFLAGAVRDHFFWPPAVQATLAAIPGDRNQAFAPEQSHELCGLPGEDTSPLFFDYHLKGLGQPFPRVSIESISARIDGGRTILLNVDSCLSIRVVQLYYSPPHPSWETREWTGTLVESLGGNRYRAVLTPAQVAENGDWYINASDERPVTAGTMIYRAREDSQAVI